MRLLILSLVLSLIFSSCHKSSSDNPMPPCIESRIVDFQKYSCEQGASIKEYSFQEKQVYVFHLGNCGGDLTATVFDSDCSTLGSLGGRSGNTKIDGIEFSNATYTRTIWQR